MFRIHSAVVFLVAYIYLSYYFGAVKCLKKQENFEVTLKSMQTCKNPSPPHTKNMKIITAYAIKNVNGKRYLSFNCSISEPIQVYNFSARTYSVDGDGKYILKFQVSQVNCWNLFVRSISMIAKIKFSYKDCMMQKGYYQFQNLDLNKLLHSLPGWHLPGIAVHEFHLVAHRFTEHCEQFLVQIT